MNTNEIRTLFQSGFDINNWKVLLKEMFPDGTLRRADALDNLGLDATIGEGYKIGNVETSDHYELGFYYYRLKGSVDRRRVSLRQLVGKHLKIDADAALAVFDDGANWRLSLVCDLRGDATTPKRFSFVLGNSSSHYRTPVERIAKLLGREKSFANLKEAFSVDALSDDFFNEYRRQYEKINLYITGKHYVKRGDKYVEERVHGGNAEILAQFADCEVPDKAVRDYVKKMMGRLVFLHFLQKKGWMCGDENYMLHLFERSAHRGNYLEAVLEPLFFGVLNTEPKQRAELFNKKGWGNSLLHEWNEIPYLNGGLFEADDADKKQVVLPEEMFRELFEFLASYNFTVDENDPDDAEVGVDPEMLGKIFESLLEDNKDKGAFYTPKEIVRYMCKESLIAFLQSRVNDKTADIRQFVETHEFPAQLDDCRGEIVQALRDVKICDPAIGSGAFPMGLLNELLRCREALEAADTTLRVELKKEIIQNNIYGVDIEKGAIDIARLRFWLSIVVDSVHPEALPNFDYKFMQGNSLIESYDGFDLSNIAGFSKKTKKENQQLTMGIDAQGNKSNLNILIKDYFRATDHTKKEQLKNGIDDEVKTLIINSIGTSGDKEAELNALRVSGNEQFFLWHTWFKDVFDQGGFDIVIGNPPYVNIANIKSKNVRKHYQKNYKTVKNKSDLYSIFTERAHFLLKSKGICSYIVSNSWMGTDSFLLFREFLVNETKMMRLVDIPLYVFPKAKVKTCVFLFSKECVLENEIILEKFDGKDFFVLDEPLRYSAVKQYKNYPFPFKDGIDLAKTEVVRLGEIAYFSLGIKTSNDNRFISSNPYVEDCYKLIRGKSFQRFTNPVSSEYIWYRPDLFMEKVGAGPRKLEFFIASPKIIIKDVASYICATIDENGYLCNDTINVIYGLDKAFDFKYILGLLNSKAVCFWHKQIYPKGLHVKLYQLKEIPIPIIPIIQQSAIVNLVDKILSLKKKESQCDISALEQEIDRQVYALYNLTPEEIAVIESQA